MRALQGLCETGKCPLGNCIIKKCQLPSCSLACSHRGELRGCVTCAVPVSPEALGITFALKGSVGCLVKVSHFQQLRQNHGSHLSSFLLAILTFSFFS